MKLEEGVPLARFTTIGTGGHARALARPESVTELQDALRFAGEHELEVATIGLGSNLLVSDAGFEGLVLKLGGGLARAGGGGEVLVAGGGAGDGGALRRARGPGPRGGGVALRPSRPGR